MPSRAVQRKKARRESKRAKKAEEVALDASKVAASVDRLTTSMTSAEGRLNYEDGSSTLALPAARLSPSMTSPRVPLKREREENNDAVDGLSRKERRKLETKRLFEKRLSRLTAAPRITAAQDGETATVAASEGVTHLRHDPRFTNGSFWKKRKERRARTIFLGGVPVSFAEQNVKDFIESVLDADSATAEYAQQLEPGTSLVESVDFLPLKFNAKLHHMYVTMASVALAGCAVSKLDKYQLEKHRLRCNFAADKTQRAEAIRRRGN